MKLVIHTLLLTNLAVHIKCQRMQDQFPFPPQFQTPSSGIMVSDSSIYLPPEPQTPIPYFTMNQMNKLPFQFLPPSGTKAPSVYPTPFSGIFSSTMRPRFDDEDEDDNDHSNRVRISSPRPQMKSNPSVQFKKNSTEPNQEQREVRAIPKMFNYNQQPQNRADKQPQAFQPLSTPEPQNTNSASRRMILTSEIQRNDIIGDHLKSHGNSPYSQLPNIFYSSTTEPAIPILRLSNEMDLDGSFSYEALGADQTHYVQHSRMENMGTDKEEQVVEGSYSYVGDNGQTYTVHYVADSNGYRASGEHLPSPPPIPEIIQRAIQYNLAEEAKRPPHTKLPWEETSPDNDYNNSDKSTRFSGPPTRNLFTGRTPEAFSFGFAQNSNSQNNLQTSAASSHIPKTNFDIAVELSKPKTNTGSITPQITFSASQGSHNPIANTQQSVSRSSSNEKPSMPQIMNYEASAREFDQETKPLWRWQYGMNANTPENPSKNSISRSFGEGDDIIINFNDMTPEQYTDMIRSQVLEDSASEGRELHNSYFNNNFIHSTPSAIHLEKSNFNNNYPLNQNKYNDESKQSNSNDIFIDNKAGYRESHNEIGSTTAAYTNDQSGSKIFETYQHEVKIQPKNTMTNTYPNIIRQQNFIPPSQLVTRSYDYDDSAYEPKKVNKDTYAKQEQKNINTPQVIIPKNSRYASEETFQSTTIQPHFNVIPNDAKPAVPTMKQNNNDFRPIINPKDSNKYESTTTEKNMEDLLQENIFLKNIVKKKKEVTLNMAKPEEQIETKNNNKSTEIKEDKPPKQSQFPKVQAEVKNNKKKTLDVADVLNYITMKNNFELSKTKPKSLGDYQQNRDGPMNYIPLGDEKRENVRNAEEDNNRYRIFGQQEEELQGMIKNYKVLQRQRNTSSANNHYSDAPQKHVKTFHSQGLPPLGRAGPSMKSYLPPSYL